MFVDHIRVHARAGRGGDGSSHFYRGKFQPKGGPDGGDGGRGGSVILLVDNSTDSLKTFFFNAKLEAEHGLPGGGNRRFGKSGNDKVYRVPSGTLVSRYSETYDDDTGEKQVHLEPVVDLTEVGTEYVLCKGGKGGKGNVHFKSSTHQAPTEYTPGEPGEEDDFYFELRSIADAGLVGFPNAGKSTLLSKLSAARPKIANYPFTTLQPKVGVMEFSETRRGTVADIPGLIEGAHANVGLGHDFLRHIMRCRMLLFVVDTAGSEARDPVSDLQTLRQEISLYSDELAKRQWIIVANKMDLPEADENLAILRDRFDRVPIIPISASSGLGLDDLRQFLDEHIGSTHGWVPAGADPAENARPHG